MCKWPFSLLCFKHDKIIFGSSDIETRDNIVLKRRTEIENLQEQQFKAGMPGVVREKI